jgi:hypothetical protein
VPKHRAGPRRRRVTSVVYSLGCDGDGLGQDSVYTLNTNTINNKHLVTGHSCLSLRVTHCPARVFQWLPNALALIRLPRVQMVMLIVTMLMRQQQWLLPTRFRLRPSMMFSVGAAETRVAIKWCLHLSWALYLLA